MKILSLLISFLFNFFLLFTAQAQTTDQTKSSEDLVFVFVEQMPEYLGGQEAMMKFLGENIRYPATALQESIEGLVVAQFVVNRVGQIHDVKVIKQLGGGTDEEAIRVITAMPDWKPGKQNGKEVSVRYTLPIRFQFGHTTEEETYLKELKKKKKQEKRGK